MNNLHAPTVPSGPTSTPTTNGTTGHLSFTELQQKKDNVEAELKALGGVLDSVCSIIQLAILDSVVSLMPFTAWS